MTHMAPEILLEGRVSKAVDVSDGEGQGEGARGLAALKLRVWTLWPLASRCGPSSLFTPPPLQAVPSCAYPDPLHPLPPSLPQVYAFGVTMWELFTGGKAFQGVPYALLGHAIAKEHKRPAFTLATPEAFRALAELCWDPDYEKRCGEWRCGEWVGFRWCRPSCGSQGGGGGAVVWQCLVAGVLGYPVYR